MTLNDRGKEINDTSSYTITTPYNNVPIDTSAITKLISSAGKNKYTDIDLSKYKNGYQASDAVNAALGLKTNAENAVANFGDFNYANESLYQDAMNAILNREKFSYDLNGDALYQQYKDNYINQGKQASADVMGQASAMTGGYGNSYAATVGNQTYQGYLQGLNDVVPQLYQMALDRYNAEGDRLATNYSLLSADRTDARNAHNDAYSKLVSDRDYYANNYNNAYNRDYSAWNDNRTYDASQYWNEYNAGYTKEQDAIANEMALKQLNESIRANQVSESQRAEANKLAREQWEYERDNPSVTYAISDFGSVPDYVFKKIDGMDSLDEIDTYLSGQVESTKIDPRVAQFIYGLYVEGDRTFKGSNRSKIEMLKRDYFDLD